MGTFIAKHNYKDWSIFFFVSIKKWFNFVCNDVFDWLEQSILYVKIYPGPEAFYFDPNENEKNCTSILKAGPLR